MGSAAFPALAKSCLLAIPSRQAWLRAGAATLVLATASLPRNVHAQSASATNPGNSPPAGSNQTGGKAAKSTVEEILVTVRLRKERAQSVPAALTVIDAKTIAAAEIHDISDLTALTPNLNFLQGYRAGIPYIAMRGISTVQGGEAPVALIVDGVQAPGLEFFNQDLLDIQDVEVLRGPQGAIYGRGAIAGALVINTTPPTNILHNNAVFDFGSGNDARFVDTFSTPVIADKLWFSGTVEEHVREGQIYDDGAHKYDDWLRDRAARFDVLAKPADGTRIDLRANLLDGTEGAGYQTVLTPSETGDFSINPAMNHPLADRRNINSLSLKIDQDMPWGGVLTSTSQIGRAASTLRGDLDFTPAPILVQENNITQRAFNQDLRYTSDADGPIRWLVGAFFQRRLTQNAYVVSLDPQNGLPSAGTPVAVSDQRDNSEAYAVYSQVVVTLPSNFHFTGALRYDVDDRYDTDRKVPGSSTTGTFDALQPQGTLSYDVTSDILGYITIGRGFRSGGFNNYQQSIDQHLPREFPEETDMSYEIGVKSQLVNNSLTLNADYYFTQFHDMQYFLTQSSPVVENNIISIDHVNIQGPEIEASYHVIPDLTLSGSLGMALSSIQDYNGTSTYVGNRAPNVYQFTFNVSADYHHRLLDDVDGFARVDYTRFGPIAYDPSNQYGYDPTNYVNLKVGLTMRGWEVALWGKNLLNQRAPGAFEPNSGGNGINERIDNTPLSIGMELGYRF